MHYATQCIGMTDPTVCIQICFSTRRE